MSEKIRELHSYLYDGHGHSTASDGMHSAQKIIEYAIKNNLDIVGLSDHNVTTNLQAFLEYADKVNSKGVKILPIPSIEISTTHGDLLVAIPDRNKADNFMVDYKKPSHRPYPLEIIEDYIAKYNAIIVFLHPNVDYVNGFKLPEIQKILEHIPKRLHKNLGIEIYNWMTQVFFWKRQQEENEIHKHSFSFGLAPFSFTDYHIASHVGKGNTELKMAELSSDEFTEAIKQRRVAPHSISNRSLPEYLEIIKASIAAEGLAKFNSRKFHVPKKG